MIRTYTASDLKEIQALTLSSWKGEVNIDSELEDFIYKFLPLYYLKDHKMTYVDYDERLNGFFITSNGFEDNDLSFFNENKKYLKKENQMLADIYREYLDYNHDRVCEHMDQNSRYLALVASAKRGTGTKLFNHVINEAKRDNIRHLYLWTDETCNYRYYEKNKFILVDTYYVKLFDRNIKTFIYRLDLEE